MFLVNPHLSDLTPPPATRHTPHLSTSCPPSAPSHTKHENMSLRHGFMFCRSPSRRTLKTRPHGRVFDLGCFFTPLPYAGHEKHAPEMCSSCSALPETHFQCSKEGVPPPCYV